MEFEFGFGKKTIKFNIEKENFIGEILPNKIEVDLMNEEEVNRAMDNPIGSERLKEIVKKGKKIVIITSDITRPMPSKMVIPVVIKELEEAGVCYSDITIVLAIGSHRPHTEDEKKYLLGESIYNKIRCIDSNPMDFKHLGFTKRGTPIDIFTEVADADIRICLGNIEYHYFAGYSGGAKAIMPGVSTRAAIQANHSRMVEEEAKTGNIDTNPVRLDLEEAIETISIDFIVNVVLDKKKQIIKAVAGHFIKAHREGCRFLDLANKIEIKNKADIVITTPGGYPKDINMYQSQKALDNAKNAVKKGGIIILVASCLEGLGEKVFEKWMINASSPQSLIVDIQKNFELGGHKAAAIAMVLQNSKIFLVSEMEEDFVRKIFMVPFSNVQDAINKAYQEQGTDAKVLTMPYGGSTLPILR
ncbi:nickel-dependent lactate racemase [Clostridium estertheticum]|uniref:nickel-dependent lactate racemase n=1 Tax=Clostridium estertheticum TaxID=238834 RepID=UPI001C0B05B0|nr:nickel-dependent lactate racemase [Clostridium estertheticum]MBU3217133.1 nickel-dependent lactate racemase [Clostridium estertheticum]WAG55032.1 nickel-dependent lactate racemase [Clostridium estertheticum]